MQKWHISKTAHSRFLTLLDPSLLGPLILINFCSFLRSLRRYLTKCFGMFLSMNWQMMTWSRRSMLQEWTYQQPLKNWCPAVTTVKQDSHTLLITLMTMILLTFRPVPWCSVTVKLLIQPLSFLFVLHGLTQKSSVYLNDILLCFTVIPLAIQTELVITF